MIGTSASFEKPFSAVARRGQKFGSTATASNSRGTSATDGASHSRAEELDPDEARGERRVRSVRCPAKRTRPPLLVRVAAATPLFTFPGSFAHRRLKEHLRQKLIDSGWRDNLKEYTMGARPFFSRAVAAFQKSARLGITTHQRPSPHRVRRAHPQQGRPDDDGRAADGRDYPARPRCAPLQHTHSRRTHTHTLFIKPTSCSRHSPPQGRCPTRSSRSCCRKSGGLPRRSRERTVSCHVGLVRVAGFGGETLWSEQHRVCRPLSCGASIV